jgi:hypothetical protein
MGGAADEYSGCWPRCYPHSSPTTTSPTGGPTSWRRFSMTPRTEEPPRTLDVAAARRRNHPLIRQDSILVSDVREPPRIPAAVHRGNSTRQVRTQSTRVGTLVDAVQTVPCRTDVRRARPPRSTGPDDDRTPAHRHLPPRPAGSPHCRTVRQYRAPQLPRRQPGFGHSVTASGASARATLACFNGPACARFRQGPVQPRTRRRRPGR